MKSVNSFFIFDTAKASGENLNLASKLNRNAISLYERKNDQDLSIVPCFFTFPHSSEFSDFILQNGWGNAWGVFIITQLTIEELQQHFRKFLKVSNEEGKEMYFRLYDPRVLRVFLPTCDERQLKDFFGPIQMFAMESEDSHYAIEYELEKGNLVSRRIHREDFWRSLGASLPIILSSQALKNMETKKETERHDDSLEIKTPPKKWNFLID